MVLGVQGEAIDWLEASGISGRGGMSVISSFFLINVDIHYIIIVQPRVLHVKNAMDNMKHYSMSNMSAY